MRKLYAAFGYTGEVSGGGTIPTAEKNANASEEFYAPKAEGEEDRPSFKKISGKELFEYGERFLRTLKTLGPDVNRAGVVEAEIARLKTEWKKADYVSNLKDGVSNILKIQREMKTKFNLDGTK